MLGCREILSRGIAGTLFNRACAPTEQKILAVGDLNVVLPLEVVVFARCALRDPSCCILRSIPVREPEVVSLYEPAGMSKPTLYVPGSLSMAAFG